MNAVRAIAVAIRTALLAWTVVACAVPVGGASTPPPAPPTVAAPVGSAVRTPGSSPTAPGSMAVVSGSPAARSSRPGIDAPPIADLAVDGGDPVAGQLGTFVWDGGGSDGPWLPGAPIGAATGEVLTATVAPAVPVSAWSALLAPAAAGDGTGAVPVGDGRGPIRFATPVRGTWTLALTVAFGDRGSATWFWRLDIP